MADFSLQLQADNLPAEFVEQLLVEGPWAPVMARMSTAENLLLEGCRGAGKTMIMRAASKRMQRGFSEGKKILGVHAIFKRYLATLPPPSKINEGQPDLRNFRAWVNARILDAIKEVLKNMIDLKTRQNLGLLEKTDWRAVIGILETTYRGGEDPILLLKGQGLSDQEIVGLQGYTLTSDLIKMVINQLQLDLLVIFLDDAAHALDTRAQGAFFTAIKALYDERLAFKISVYPAVTRYGTDFSYGHDAIVVPLGEIPNKDKVSSFTDLLKKRQQLADDKGKTFLDEILANKEWIDLLVYCSNANPRGLLKLVAQVQTQLGGKDSSQLRFEDIRQAVVFVMDKHLDNTIPGVIKDLDPRLLKSSELLLTELRQKIVDKPGPYESSRPRGYLAITNSMQVPYLCQISLKLLVAANVVFPEGPARLSKRETGTIYLLHPGFMFRDNVIGPYFRGTLAASDWLGFFHGMSSRVHAEITKGAELWSEIIEEANSEPRGQCENGHPIFDPQQNCDICGAPNQVRSPVDVLLDKDLSVLDLSDGIKDRLRAHGFNTVRKLFEASQEEIDAVDYIGEVRVQMIRNAVSAAVDEFVSG